VGALVELVAAAPAAPVVIGAGELVILFAWVVLFCLLYTYRYTLGALILKLADMVDDIWLVGDDLADALEKLDHIIMQSISNGLAGLESAASSVWSAIAWTIRATGDAIVDVAAAGLQVQAALVGAIIPEAIEARTGPLTIAVSRSNAAANRRAIAEAHARAAGIDRLNRDLTAEELARQRGIDAISSRLDRLVIPRVNGLSRGLDALREWTHGALQHRIGRLEKALAAGAIGAVAIAAITRVFPYWQCTNVRRFNRLLCRSPIGALDDLFALAFLAIGPLSLVGFAQQLQEVMDLGSSGVRYFVTETRS
jgi:hypothetical protein